MGCNHTTHLKTEDKATNTESDAKIEPSHSFRSSKSRYVITINADALPMITDGYGNQSISFVGSLSPKSPNGGVFGKM